MQLDSPAIQDTVRALASHALPAFGIALAVAAVAVSAVWWLSWRYRLRSETRRLTPLGTLLATLTLGFSLLTSAAALFAEIAENLGNGKALGALDQLFSDTVQATLSPGAFGVFATLTHLGDPITLTALGVGGAAALARHKRYSLCAGWVLALGGNALLNPLLKRIFERTRPVHDNLRAFADGWSFPSGHASGSVVAYGMLAYVALQVMPPRWQAARLPVLLATTVIALTVCASRVFVQVHFATDVLAGMASGTAWLAVCVGGLELARYRAGR